MQIAEYLRLLPSEFSNSLAPPPKLTPLKFIFPQRFQTSLQNVKLIYPAGWDFSFHQFYFFFLKYGLWLQIWLPSKVSEVSLICSKARGQTTSAFLLPRSSWGFSRTALAWSRGCRLHGDKSLQLHQLQPARSACELTDFKKKKRVKIYRFIPLPLLCRLVKNNPNMAHWLLTRIIAGEYALNSCSAGEKLMEGVLAACLSLRRERESVSPRGMDGAAVIVVNSSSVYAWANSLQTETGDILHTVFQTRTGPLN